jgi:hypothetical protein
VDVKEFEVSPDEVDATIERLAAKDAADVARPALTVLALNPARPWLSGIRPPTEAERRQLEKPAYSVARGVIAKKTADPGSAEQFDRVAGDLATSWDEKVEIRRVAIERLARNGFTDGPMTEFQRKHLASVAGHSKDDPSLRARAARALLQTAFDEGFNFKGGSLPPIAEIIRAQPTLAARHQAFNELTNLGKRLYQLPHDDFVDLLRVGFELIDDPTAEAEPGAYFTARNLGYMLKRADEFSPPQAEHKGATGLAPSFFTRTVTNAREWWRETGHAALDAIAPQQK